jgi:hypothetical protein
MRERWLRIGVLAGALFAINVAARLVARLAFHNDDDRQTTVGLLSMLVIGLTFAALAFVWGRDRPLGVLVADLAGAAVIGCALTIFVGPFISGEGPFSDGAGVFFGQIWQYAGFFGGGTLVGFLVLTALGMDYKSKRLKRIAQTGLAKPRRAVRR